MSSAKDDTIYVADPVSNHVLVRVMKPQPVKLNGEQIYPSSQVTTEAKYIGDEGNFHTYIFNKLKSQLNTLVDGMYFFSISNVVISKEGKLVYYVYEGIHKAATFNNKAVNTDLGINKQTLQPYGNPIILDAEDNVQPESKDIINEKVKELLKNPALQFKPAELDKKPVNYQTTMFTIDNTIQVRNHAATFSASDNAL
jgi:hypothetical protein